MQNSKQYDLEDRTKKFAVECRKFILQLSKTIGNYEDSKQLVRASGSQAANYIEANEALSKKDFSMRIKICRKEAKECQLWINLVDINENPKLKEIQVILLQEAKELTKIFGSILEKTK